MTILMSHLRYSKTEVVLDRQQWRAVYGHVTMCDSVEIIHKHGIYRQYTYNFRKYIIYLYKLKKQIQKRNIGDLFCPVSLFRYFPTYIVFILQCEKAKNNC